VLLALCAPLILAQSDAVVGLNLTFTTIDVPGASVTSVNGINIAGDMVGHYGQSTSGASHGFLLSDGVFTYFDYPGQSVTVPSGINDSGLIVGYAGSLREQGFLYDGSTFTSIRDGSDSATVCLGIDDAGDIVGGAGTPGVTRGFELHAGQFKNISPPPGGWIYVYATGINNLGEIVGWTSGASISGFSYKHGKFQTIAFPGAIQTEALAINDSGIVVGWYLSGSSAFGFALSNGRYTSFSYPGAKGTFPYGINTSGQVVGSYTLDYQSYHGFVTSPLTAADFQ